MRRILLAVLAISAAGATEAAAASGYPYCLRGCDFGAGDCSYYTYQQCQATASGREAWCDVNPAFHQGRDAQPVRSSRRRF